MRVPSSVKHGKKCQNVFERFHISMVRFGTKIHGIDKYEKSCSYLSISIFRFPFFQNWI